MKRILFTDLSSGFGGSSIVLYDLIMNLNRERYQPVLLIARNGPNFDKIKKLGVKVIKEDFKGIGLVETGAKNSYKQLFLDLVIHFLPNAFKFKRIIKNEKIDIVHINNNIQFYIDFIYGAKLAAIPCVCHIRETRSMGKLDKIFGKLVDKIIVLNKNVLQGFEGTFGSKKTTLIYDGIQLNDRDLNKADGTRIRNEFGLDNEFSIGILGRLVESKGFDDFIEAAKIVKKEKNNIKCFIIGDDPDSGKVYNEYLKEKVNQSNLSDNVIFTGWRSDKFDIIQALDVVIQSAREPEGFGLTCVEAMALSKPVIATDVPGPSDIVVHNRTGYLVPSKNPEALAMAIIKLAESSDIAEKFGKAGRQRVEEQFDIKKNARKIENIYETVLS